eukprot:363584-Chlamydomonas_euryale.AAC.5
MPCVCSWLVLKIGVYLQLACTQAPFLAVAAVGICYSVAQAVEMLIAHQGDRFYLCNVHKV